LGVYEDLIGSSSRRLRLNDGSAASRPRSERSGKMMHGH